jgi:hypothetical protein
MAQRGMELSRIAFGYFGGAIFAGHSMLYACFFIDCAALRWRFEEEVRFNHKFGVQHAPTLRATCSLQMFVGSKGPRVTCNMRRG